MNKYIYGYVYFGNWEEEGSQFIKINKKDKENFIKYCEESLKIKTSEDIKLNLLGFVDNIEIYNSNLTQNGRYSDITTVQQHQNEIKEQLILIDEMKEENYLYNQRNLIENLSTYKFLD